MTKEELTNKVTEALIKADTLLWAIAAGESQENLLDKAIASVDSIREIAITISKPDKGADKEMEDSKKDDEDFINIPF